MFPGHVAIVAVVLDLPLGKGIRVFSGTNRLETYVVLFLSVDGEKNMTKDRELLVKWWRSVVVCGVFLSIDTAGEGGRGSGGERDGGQVGTTCMYGGGTRSLTE